MNIRNVLSVLPFVVFVWKVLVTTVKYFLYSMLCSVWKILHVLHDKSSNYVNGGVML